MLVMAPVPVWRRHTLQAERCGFSSMNAVNEEKYMNKTKGRALAAKVLLVVAEKLFDLALVEGLAAVIYSEQRFVLVALVVTTLLSVALFAAAIAVEPKARAKRRRR